MSEEIKLYREEEQIDYLIALLTAFGNVKKFAGHKLEIKVNIPTREEARTLLKEVARKVK